MSSLLNLQSNDNKIFGLDYFFLAILTFIVWFMYFTTNFWLSLSIISGTSMMPTLSSGDTLLTNRLANYKRGDVVVFSYDENNDYVKRIIGIEGDEIIIYNNNVQIKYAGTNETITLKEPYIMGNTNIYNQNYWKLNEGEVFVLGDNRTVSDDSRRFGPIKTTQIKGKISKFSISIKKVTSVIFG